MKRDLPAQETQKDKLKETLRLNLSNCHTPWPTWALSHPSQPSRLSECLQQQVQY